MTKVLYGPTPPMGTTQQSIEIQQSANFVNIFNLLILCLLFLSRARARGKQKQFEFLSHADLDLRSSL